MSISRQLHTRLLLSAWSAWILTRTTCKCTGFALLGGTSHNHHTRHRRFVSFARNYHWNDHHNGRLSRNRATLWHRQGCDHDHEHDHNHIHNVAVDNNDDGNDNEGYGYDGGCGNDFNFIGYGLGNVNLYETWLMLVRNNEVSVETTVNIDTNKLFGHHNHDDENDDADGTRTDVLVRYGVRLDENNECTEFAKQIFLQQGNANADKNGHDGDDVDTFSSTQTIEETSLSQSNMRIPPSSYRRDGLFAAQLLMIRTLRPPPSLGFLGCTSSTPPIYDKPNDSFVTGPLALTNRPKAGFLNNSSPQYLKLNTPWDVYHNISPCDARGHFLLLPTLLEEGNYRGQALIQQDCHDLVRLTSTVSPAGSLLISFNSVGAGASQNHIHCHAWPSPPVPLLDKNQHTRSGWDAYAVSQTTGMYDFCDLFDGQVEVTYLEYPCFCVVLSSSSPSDSIDEHDVDTASKNGGNNTKTSVNSDDRFTLLAKALSQVLGAIGDAPFNIGMVNRPSSSITEEHQEQTDDGKEVTFGDSSNGDADDCSNNIEVDVYVFVRSKECAQEVLPTSRLGTSEMMGMFHVSSQEELDHLVPPAAGVKTNMARTLQDALEKGQDEGKEEGIMARALRDVSYQEGGDLWETIQSRFMSL